MTTMATMATHEPLGGAHDVGCEELHHLPNITDLCVFVKDTDSCQIDEGFFNYTVMLYCASIPVWLGCIFLVIWWLFMFSGLAVTADDFFCPSLAVISRSLKLSHNVAGVTFLAFGNGAPDVFSAVAAIGNAKAGDAGLAIGALFGAGVFVTAVVAGTISIISPFHVMKRPLMRDVIFYLTSVYTVWYIMWDKKITQIEAAVLLMLYCLYVVVVVVGRYINQKLRKKSKNKALLEEEPQPAVTAEEDSDDEEGMRDSVMKALTNRGRRASSTISHHSHHSHHSYQSNTSAIFTTHNSTHGNQNANGINNAGFNSVMSGGASPLANNEVLDTRTPSIQTEENRSVRARAGSHIKPGDSEAKRLLWMFLEGANPINVGEWPELAIYWKVYEIFKAPIVLCLNLTVPVVDDEEEGEHGGKPEESQSLIQSEVDGEEQEPELRNWNRPLNSLQLFIGPMFASLVTKIGLSTIGGSFPVWVLIMVLSAALAILVFVTSKTDERPRYHVLFAYLGFLIAVIWIYSIANEIVNILQALGVVFDLSDAILGLTLLAWGNSIGDLIADMTMARQGYPRMGISACFGGPVFNMLIGLGIPFTIACAQHGGTFELKVTLEEMVLAGGLGLSLLCTLILVPLCNFYMSRPYGIFLLCLYVVFILIAVLVETNVIQNFEL